MSETIKTLIERRSVRSFTDQQVSSEDLNKILEAGIYSPTGGGSQSTIFIAVQDPAIRQKLSQMNAQVMGKEGIDPYYGAPTIILVLADKSKPTPVEDGSIALANLHNAAFSLGLGACWIHRAKEMFESEEGKSLLKEWGFTDDYVGVGALLLGYAKEGFPQAAPRKDGRIKIV